MPDGVDLSNDIIDDVAKTLAAMPSLLRAGFVAGAFAYEVAAVAWPTVAPLPASRLNHKQQLRYFEGWWHSPLSLQHEFARAAKGLLCLSYYETPEVRAMIGYTPDEWVAKVTARRLAVHSDAIAAQEAAITRPDPLPRRFSDDEEHKLAG
jgi:hypothetical protein